MVLLLYAGGQLIMLASTQANMKGGQAKSALSMNYV